MTEVINHDQPRPFALLPGWPEPTAGAEPIATGEQHADGSITLTWPGPPVRIDTWPSFDDLAAALVLEGNTIVWQRLGS